MEENPENRITDVGLAWDMAYAQKPYMDVAFTARHVGLLGIATEIEQRAETAGKKVEEIAQAEGRMVLKLKEQQAFSRLCDQTEEDILTLTDFKISNPEGAVLAWQNLMGILAETPSPVIRFVEYSEGSFALVGNVAEAANTIDEPIIAAILNESAMVIEAIKAS